MEIYVQCVGATGTGAVYDSALILIKSDVDGLAAGAIPRGAHLSFEARRGQRGRRVRFSGVAATTVKLPALIGTP